LAQALLRKEAKMEVGDKITVPFGTGEKEGTVYKIFPKTVYIKVDFPKHKGKVVKRSIMELKPEEAAKKKKVQDKKKKKAAKEDRKREKAAKKSTT
jgi:hypothetical protein